MNFLVFLFFFFFSNVFIDFFCIICPFIFIWTFLFFPILFLLFFLLLILLFFIFDSSLIIRIRKLHPPLPSPSPNKKLSCKSNFLSNITMHGMFRQKPNRK